MGGGDRDVGRASEAAEWSASWLTPGPTAPLALRSPIVPRPRWEAGSHHPRGGPGHGLSKGGQPTGVTIPCIMTLQASPFQTESSYRHHQSRQNDITGITNPGRMIFQASLLGRIILQAFFTPGRMILQASPFHEECYYRHQHSRQNHLRGITIPGRMILQASPFKAESSYRHPIQAESYNRHHHSRQNDLAGVTMPGRVSSQASPFQTE